MNPYRIAAIALRQFYLMRSSPTRILPLFAWVAVDIVLWGFISRYLDEVAAAPVHFAPVLVGAVLVWNFFTRVMQGVTNAFFEDVWSRNFFNIFASPVTISEYIAGLVLVSVVTSLLGLAAMLAIALAVFGIDYFAFGLLSAAFLLVLFLFGIALGVFACAVVLRLGPAAEWLIWPVPALLSPFVGVFYPLSVLPAWMQAIGRGLPPSYVFEEMRALLAGEPWSATRLVGSLLLAAGYVALAWWTFAVVHRRAVRSGLLARYSAESVG